MSEHITGISSMATRQMLSELVADYARLTGADGGRRIGRRRGRRTARRGRRAVRHRRACRRCYRPARWRRPRRSAKLASISRDRAWRSRSRRVRRRRISRPKRPCARRCWPRAAIGYSTGPSGVHLSALVRTMGHRRTPSRRASCRRRPACRSDRSWRAGEVELGFQQLSELMHLPGIEVDRRSAAGDSGRHRVFGRRVHGFSAKRSREGTHRFSGIRAGRLRQASAWDGAGLTKPPRYFG